MPEHTHAVLLVNLGSPDDTSVPAVRRYLAEFLMDKYVIDSPWLIRAAVVYGAILPKRPQKTAEAYKKIWTDDGSPLITTSKETQKKVQENSRFPIALAMRYGNPSIPDVLAQLLKTHPQLSSIHVIPLYPHYAMSSYETVVKKVEKSAKRLSKTLKLTYEKPFYDDEDYIKNLVTSMAPYLENSFDFLLFSYHGLPERHLKKSDPTRQHCLKVKDCCNHASLAHDTCYRAQVYTTTKKVTEALGLNNDRYSVSFQSRLGRDPWLRPYTDKVLIALAESGVKRLLVICPAFVSDCLETLEEIEKEGRELFLHSGGESFTMIPCLNTHPDWIQTLTKWANRSLRK